MILYCLKYFSNIPSGVSGTETDIFRDSSEIPGAGLLKKFRQLNYNFYLPIERYIFSRYVQKNIKVSILQVYYNWLYAYWTLHTTYHQLTILKSSQEKFVKQVGQLKPANHLLSRSHYLLFSFFCYLASPWPSLGHYRGGSLTHPMSIIASCLFLIQRTPRASQRLGP